MRPWADCARHRPENHRLRPHGFRALENGVLVERISRSTHPTTRPAFPGFLGWDQHHGLPGNRRMGAAREFLSKNAAAVRAKPMRPWAACFSANGENNLTAAPHGFRALENGVLVERSSRSTHPTTRPAFPGFLGWDQHHDLPSNRRMGAAREFLSKNAVAERAEPMRPWAAGPAWVSRAGERGSRGEDLALHPSYESPCFSMVSIVPRNSFSNTRPGKAITTVSRKKPGQPMESTSGGVSGPAR